MALIGNIVIYIMMAFVLIGAFALVFRGDRGIGREFKEGLYSIGPLMIGKVVAGILAMVIAVWIAVPTAQRFEREEKEREAAEAAEAALAAEGDSDGSAEASIATDPATEGEGSTR